MNAERYRAISEPLRRNPRGVKLVLAANGLLTSLGYLSYPLLIGLLIAQQDPFLVKALVVPGAAFVAVSLFRRAFNAPRPYELLDIEPIIKKDARGRSFPSRHAFSMFMIAISWLAYMPAVGWALLGAGVLLASTRVVGGVHFPRDVIAGALVALAAGIVGFWLV